jgi:hypothetical protein
MRLRKISGPIDPSSSGVLEFQWSPILWNSGASSTSRRGRLLHQHVIDVLVVEYPQDDVAILLGDEHVDQTRMNESSGGAVSDRPGSATSREFIRARRLFVFMGTDAQPGPWVLALGTLAIGVGAAIAEVRRRRTSAENRFEAALDP